MQEGRKRCYPIAVTHAALMCSLVLSAAVDSQGLVLLDFLATLPSIGSYFGFNHIGMEAYRLNMKSCPAQSPYV